MGEMVDRVELDRARAVYYGAECTAPVTLNVGDDMQERGLEVLDFCAAFHFSSVSGVVGLGIGLGRGLGEECLAREEPEEILV